MQLVSIRPTWMDRACAPKRHTLRQEYRMTFLNSFQTGVRRLIGKNLLPSSRIAHIGQVEPIPTYVLHLGKLGIKKGRWSIRSWTVIAGTKINGIPVPFGPDVGNIVKMRILAQRSDVLRL